MENLLERPIIVAVDDDRRLLSLIGTELHNRYAADYDIELFSSPEEALGAVDRFSRNEREVAVALADEWMPGIRGTDFLIRVHMRFPEAKRALLVELGDRAINEPVLSAMALGAIDTYLRKPLRPGDEPFHRLVTDLLDEWYRSQGRDATIQVVGDLDDRAFREMCELLARNAIAFGAYSLESPEGRELLAQTGRQEGPFPVVILYEGLVLAGPTPRQIADVLIPRPRLDSLLHVVVVGAGPAGLSAAVYAASEGLRVHVIEREAIGGQAGTSSLIRNYLGYPRGISGADLAARAYQQAWLFGATFTFVRGAVGLSGPVADGDSSVLLSDGTKVRALSVVIATGVHYRRLGVPSVEQFVGLGVFYGAGRAEARDLRGKDVYVVGGANSAGQAALFLARFASRVTLLVRGTSLESTMSNYLITEIDATPNIHLRTRTEVVGAEGTGRLERLVLRSNETGEVDIVPAAAVFLLIGAVPPTEWLRGTLALDEAGFILTGGLLDSKSGPAAAGREPLPYETSIPGVFAVGDVRAGSVKRVASAVGEGAMAVEQVHRYLGLQEARAGKT